MDLTLLNLEVKLLEKMYLEEVEILKLQLLTGAFGKSLEKQRTKTLQLANMIHEKQFGTNGFSWENA
ncbi:MAG: hypothetical protein ACXVBX_12210 [Flavisolibacter sp.]